jgi:hypothetical protein
VQFWSSDNNPVTLANNGEAWKIVIHYMKGSREIPVTFTTAPASLGGNVMENLSVSSDDKFNLFTFRRLGDSLLEHSKKGYNITSISFETGTNRNPTTPIAGCSPKPTTNPTELNCTCGSGGDCGLVLHVCKVAPSDPTAFCP